MLLHFCYYAFSTLWDNLYIIHYLRVLYFNRQAARHSRHGTYNEVTYSVGNSTVQLLQEMVIEYEVSGVNLAFLPHEELC